MQESEQNETASDADIDPDAKDKIEQRAVTKPAITLSATKAKGSRSAKSTKAKKKTGPKSSKTTKKRLPRVFPAVTLEEALRIPTAIKLNNGGNPWAPDQVGQAIGIKSNRTEFFYRAGGSVAYGLTVGGWKADRIELSALGREVLYAGNAQLEHAKKVEAFLNIEVFKNVLEYYKGSNLPEMKESVSKVVE